MAIVEAQRVANVSEYLIQLFIAEDLLRQHEFDINKVLESQVFDLSSTDEEREAYRQWLETLKQEMHEQNLVEKGHVARAHEIIKELSEINFYLLRSDRTFRGIFDQAKLHINRFIENYGGSVNNPILVCLEALYLKKRKRNAGASPLDERDQEGLFAFSDLLSYISYRYKAKHENDEG